MPQITGASMQFPGATLGSINGVSSRPVGESIKDALTGLLKSYDERIIKVDKIKRLINEIGALVKNIGSYIAKATDQDREKMYAELGAIITQLQTASRQSDTDATQLEDSLIQLKTSLETLLSGQAGGFKHSRRNSRKYMMKRVYSNRSLVRKRRSRTKRRKNNKKK